MGERVRAAVIDGAGSAPAVQEIELADLREDEVLVRISTTGICHTDVAWADGELFDEFPVVVGHESAGIVEATGKSVERVKKGDRVVLSLAHHCGHCAFCESGSPMLCDQREEKRPRLLRDGKPLVQGFGTGGMAEATIVRDVSAIKIPDDVPLEVASVAGCAVATGLGAVLNIAQVGAGSTVAILGCGGIGVCTLMGAKVSGAERIVAVDPSQARRDLAAKLGATDVLTSDEQAIKDLEPDGFDYVFECTGKTEPMEMAIRLTRRGGTVTVIGAPPPGSTFSIDALEFVVSQRKLLGCLTGDLRPNIDFDKYFRLYRRGLLDLDALITSTVSLEEIATGFERSRNGEGIRTLVQM
ncbi:MAG TPA: alcohol dehydrogenase catalytic domain-containing protein [Actinomycetota bacterium]|nr:alcohol dehydrogenase catalytic domain-containing protein [Actinomycetota bacterium]